MKKSLRFAFIFGLLLLLVACSSEEEPDAPATAVPPTAETISQPTDTAVSQPTDSANEPTDSNQTEVIVTEADWPPPAKQYEEMSRQPVSDAEREAAQQLESHVPPERDDIALAVIYRGATPPTEAPTAVTEPLPVGTIQNITVNNTDLNTNHSPPFELKYVSDHAYFWFDSTEGLREPSQSELEAAGAGFDEIYENSHRIFGPEDSPGIDGDPRIHIVNASPLNLCDISSNQLDSCYLAGYFSSHDLVPSSVDPTSNGREMFVMNGRNFGSTFYLDVLAHEFRHMIEENYDTNDWDWEVEGSAMLAEELLGYPGDGVYRANSFLQNPDQQLNRWTDGNPTAHYGQGYLLNRYIYNRLGGKLYSEFAAHPDQAFHALDEIAAQNDRGFASGLDLWLDWLAALAIHNEGNAPEKYALVGGLNTASMESLREDTATTVNQYAADYYELNPDDTITFMGSNHVPLTAVQPTSGSHMWVANRANMSASNLMHTFDLTGVDSATLEYDVYRDIELGYDFAYVSISTDGGQTWTPLTGTQMQGEAFADDPSDSALTKAFYTGHGQNWRQETIDLTPFAGQEVLLRFEYVTDPILTFEGLALDNIAIPEIGFFDDAETDAGWQANGFVRSTGYLPQTWHLILITFAGDTPVVERIVLTEDNTAVIPPSASSQNPILIVAATAPMTLQPGHYQLSVDR